MSALRLAFVTDIHHGEDHFTKKGSAALPLLDEFARFVADANVDAVIDMGDRISDEERSRDFAREREVAEAFAQIAAPRFHIVGNHDRDHLSVADNAEIFDQDMTHRVVDLGRWQLVMWQADTLIRRPGGFVLTEADLLWLSSTVRDAVKPLLIVSHVPISGHAQTGNYYFERNPESSVYPGADRVRAALRLARVPVVWVAGHVHWNTVTNVDGIPHFTLQSLTETFTTHPEPAAAWGLLELSDTIAWQAFGRDGMKVSLPTPDTLRRWVAPLPRFEDHPELRLRRLQRQAAE